MYKNEEGYLAEGTGFAIGRRRGREEGRSAGYNEGWNDAIEKSQPTLDAVVRERDELRFAFYSVMCALYAAMEVLETAPQDMRNRMMLEYAEYSKIAKERGEINVMPHSDSAVKSRAPDAAALIEEWWNQTLKQAKNG